MEWLTEQAEAIWRSGLAHLASPALYAQLAVVAAALALAWVLAMFLAARAKALQDRLAPEAFAEIRSVIGGVRRLLLPAMAATMLSVGRAFSLDAVGEAWLVQAVQGAAFIFLIYAFASLVIRSRAVIFLLRWVGIPVSLLYIVGWLDDVTRYLSGVALNVGNIEISLYTVVRALLFGVVLFWLGRASNATGQRVIRTHAALEPAAREVAAKLFEVAVYSVTFILLLNVAGIDLTALAVFGGALGVGLGLGLQPIASNFVSGLIILLERSLTIGDYIELEDGRSGTLRELSIRSATLETFDGKDIIVPNEKFVTTAFVNWTHNHKKQRYSLHFQVAYGTDFDLLFKVVRETVASHPKVMSGGHLPIAERPDAEIEKFGDSGVDILVEFWMEGIDDGENRVGGDLNLMIWTALKANGIEIPFPQREVRLLGGQEAQKG